LFSIQVDPHKQTKTFTTKTTRKLKLLDNNPTKIVQKPKENQTNTTKTQTNIKQEKQGAKQIHIVVEHVGPKTNKCKYKYKREKSARLKVDFRPDTIFKAISTLRTGSKPIQTREWPPMPFETFPQCYNCLDYLPNQNYQQLPWPSNIRCQPWQLPNQNLPRPFCKTSYPCETKQTKIKQQNKQRRQQQQQQQPSLPTLNQLRMVLKMRQALKWKQSKLSKPIFKFELSLKAAEENTKVLEAYEYNLTKIINQDAQSILKPGSEFRPISLLEAMFQGHPLWERMKNILTTGAHSPLTELSEDDRQADLKTAIEYGNHKGAINEGERVIKELESEINQGWQLPISIHSLDKVHEAIVAPVGMVKQVSIEADGTRGEKYRMTHDQSFPFTSGQSVNSRMKWEEIQDCVFGFALRRFIYTLVAYRIKYPQTPILLAKTDYKSAYRRMHQDGLSALRSMITTTKLVEKGKEIAIVCLRATFGNAANPSLFSILSESATDLSNQILRLKGKIKLPKSQYENLIKEPIVCDKDRPFAPARKMVIEPDVSAVGYNDNYLDDCFGMILWLLETNPKWGIESQLLALDILGRPNSNDEPLPRKELLSGNKMEAEGTPTEKLIILGWEIHTRDMTIGLPLAKFEKYTRQIEEILKEPKKAREKKELESLVGRLQHVASILPTSRHFIGRLNNAMNRANQYTRLSQNELDDLKLWKKFLYDAHKGIDINLITPRLAERILITDASLSKGMGGFNVKSGRAWRWPIPEEWKTMSINTLEFITTIIALELDLLEDPPNTSKCYLILTDNMSARGWLRKTNFCDSPDSKIQLQTARHLAHLLINNKVCLFSQWLQGEKNEVADMLSREQTMSDKEITNKILDIYQLQVPPTFKVSQLPQRLTSRFLQRVQSWQSTAVQQTAPNNDTVATGSDGSNLQEMPETSIHTWTTSIDTNKLNSSPHLCTPSEQNSSTPFEQLASWHQRLAASTLPAWQRPLYSREEETQGTIWTANFHDFYQNK
jgi:hypothetical protein